ncbi:uncharacterized protein LOC122629476 [Vespula pensylvanica]|uniref:uncharacterized protein LOC122629476 n=1 Tax=Vespula pensylvanica TaxID=30213 RepID=UPI001CBA3202|nr:uncharacterized protein LOC122629476 [Vespula pensylvanica]
MGNYTSKFLSHDSVEENNTNVTETVEQLNVVKECNSITPSTTHRKLMIDPRSITAEICRTPIKIHCTPSKSTRMGVDVIPKHMQRKPYLETNFDATISPLTSNKYLDPRSPNIDQPRTPILIENFTTCETPTIKLKNNAKIYKSMNLTNCTSLGFDPRSPSTDFDRTPILIQKTTKYLKTESTENLELHNEPNDHQKFLYCETTSSNTPEILALVDETCEAIKSLQLNISENTDELELHVSENTNHISNEDDNNDNVCSEKSSQNENITRINTIKIWRDSVLSESLVQSEINEYSNQENDEEKFSCPSKEEIEAIFDDDVMKGSTPIPEQSKIEVENKNVQDTLENRKKVKTNGKTFVPYNSNINETSKKRTPLRSRCNNAQLDTILTKSPQHMLQNKNFSNIIQHENTPPHKRSYAKSKFKGIQWDVNSTVII